MRFLSRSLTLGLFLVFLADAQIAARQSPPEIKIGPPQSTAPAGSGKSKLQQQQEAAFDVCYSQAVALRKARDFEKAAAKFQEAEALADQLTDTKYSWLQDVLAGEAECFIKLKKYEEAEAALLRRTSPLQIATKELDPSYPHNFSLLGDVSARQQKWDEAERYLQQAAKAHDKVIEHLSSPGENAMLLTEERRAKAFDQFHLALVYSHGGKYADALVLLDESFTAASAAGASSSQLMPIANAAKEIAVHTGFPSDVEKWHARLAKLSDSGSAPKN